MPPIDVPAVIQSVAQIAFAVILALIPFIVKSLFPQIQAWLESKSQDAQWGLVIQAAYAIVAQVEQLKKIGLIPDNAAAKKWATTALHDWLMSRGIDLPISDLTTAIESAVNELPHTAKAS